MKMQFDVSEDMIYRIRVARQAYYDDKCQDAYSRSCSTGGMTALAMAIRIIRNVRIFSALLFKNTILRGFLIATDRGVKQFLPAFTDGLPREYNWTWIPEFTTEYGKPTATINKVKNWVELAPLEQLALEAE